MHTLGPILSVALVFVVYKGLLVVTHDLVSRLEQEPQTSTEMSWSSYLKTILFYGTTLISGVLVWRLVERFALDFVLVKALISAACLYGFGLAASYGWYRFARRRERSRAD